MASYFTTYEQWREAYGARCGIKLTPEYCRERIRALSDPKEPSTTDFLKHYGEEYLHQVIQWFERAAREV